MPCFLGVFVGPLFCGNSRADEAPARLICGGSNPRETRRFLERPVDAKLLHRGATQCRQARRLDAATIARHLAEIVFSGEASDAVPDVVLGHLKTP